MGVPEVSVVWIDKYQTVRAVAACSLLNLRRGTSAPRAPTALGTTFEIRIISCKYILHRVLFLDAELYLVNPIFCCHSTKVEAQTVHVIIVRSNLILEGLPVLANVEIMIGLPGICFAILNTVLDNSVANRALSLEAECIGSA